MKNKQTPITIKTESEKCHLFVADHKERINVMHVLARAGIIAGYHTSEGFQSNRNDLGRNFWGSVK